MSREKQIDTPTNTPTQNQFTNSELKQIEEMAKCCPYHDNGKCHPTDNETVDCDLMCNMFGFMANLENAGYRKQSEGEWLFNRGRTYGEPAYYCSNCSEGGSEYGYDKFCPNCGAKMKGGESNGR